MPNNDNVFFNNQIDKRVHNKVDPIITKLDKHLETMELHINENRKEATNNINEMRKEAANNINELRKEAANNINEMRKEAREDRRALARYMLALSSVFVGSVITIAVKIF